MENQNKNLVNSQQRQTKSVIAAVVLKEKSAVLLGIPSHEHWIRDARKTLVPLWGFQGRGLNLEQKPATNFNQDPQIEILAYQPDNLRPRVASHWAWVPTHLLNPLVEGILVENVVDQLEWVNQTPDFPLKAVFFLPENSAELGYAQTA